MIRRLLLLGMAGALVLTGCGKDSNTGSSGSADCPAASPALDQLPTMPEKFPVPDKVTYTSTEMAGPTTIIEGYWDGDLEDAYNGWKAAFPAAGYDVTFDELEENDSEVNFDGFESNGQVKLERDDQCSTRTDVKVTIRPD